MNMIFRKVVRLNMNELEPELLEAIGKLIHYVSEVTGQKPSQKEIASALGRYFILSEIGNQIKWDRENPDF